MKRPNWTQADSHKAKQIWEEYQKKHNISNRIGQTAGIDPKSRRIWFGESIRDIVKRRNTEGLDSPLFFERVGSEIYFRKGGRRRSTERFRLTVCRQSHYRLPVKIG